ncbi:CotH kinase family protein [Demequina soli]|uniref:CotH kinase family protein n=1 Tax=Demequina soli TaxID=1638987 RepID=UPI0007813BD5|nr:CotH kinase family protein [Demequina soli]
MNLSLTDVLDAIDGPDDDAFATIIASALDVDAFATYLAFQEIVDSYDHVGGPCEHAFMSVDPATGRIAVVDWALDVAVGTRAGLGDAEGARVLARRFLSLPEFAARVDAELERLAAALVASHADDAAAADQARVLKAHAPVLGPAPQP